MYLNEKSELEKKLSSARTEVFTESNKAFDFQNKLIECKSVLEDKEKQLDAVLLLVSVDTDKGKNISESSADSVLSKVINHASKQSQCHDNGFNALETDLIVMKEKEIKERDKQVTIRGVSYV
jgi:hypothetical protein